MQALARAAQTPLATSLNALVIAVVTALPLAGYLLLADLEALAAPLDEQPRLNVFIERSATRAQAQALLPRLRSLPGVQSVRFVSREEALAELRRSPELAEAVAALDQNPLPDAFVLTLGEEALAQSDRIEREVRALPGVSSVQSEWAWGRRLRALIRLARAAVGSLAALLALALIAVTFSTIRSAILGQREEIELSRLIGATAAYVRRPFLYYGTLLGLLGGLAGLAVVFGIFAWLGCSLGGLGELYGIGFRLHFPGPTDVAAALLASGFLGWLGAFLSVSVHLLKGDNS